MKCERCGKELEKYYHDAGDHFGGGTAPGSGWRYKPCGCKDKVLMICPKTYECDEENCPHYGIHEEEWSCKSSLVSSDYPVNPTGCPACIKYIEPIIEFISEEEFMV